MGKLALAIHDLSCYSKSSLTVVIPILESLGIECAVLPTAILSTQTDGFDSFYIEDKTEAMKSILASFIDMNINFDGLYSGYLASIEQIKIVEKAISSFSPFTLVDPVFADNGEMYSTKDYAFVSEMRTLINRADIITPNYTEAAILTENEIKTALNNRDIELLVKSINKFNVRKGVITSVPLLLGTKANIAFENNEVRIINFDDLPVSFPGSGDLFASALFSLILRDMNFFEAAKLATLISTEAVKNSLKENRERRLGISLIGAISEIKRLVL